VSSPIRLVVSDVDGTLVTSDKTLTDAAVAAVARLHDAGIRFAVTSGRPPRGMSMLVGPLALTDPIGGFNGGLVVRPDLSVLEEHSVPDALVPQIIEVLSDNGVDVWCYQGNDWFVLDAHGDHVAQEAATVQFAPSVADSYAGLVDGVVKIVGVSDDPATIAAALHATRDAFGDGVAASTSQPYYLDVTHPAANKGAVIAYLSKAIGVTSDEIATIGDGPNDTLMFAASGLSIAMGNSAPAVQRAATHVSRSNDEDGFALAIERFILAA
jgi:Cof subfamily protein (haloacid dehalogenase superfamily)